MGTTTAYRPPVKCPLCYARFEGEGRLRRHLDAHSREELVDFVVRTMEEREVAGTSTEV